MVWVWHNAELTLGLVLYCLRRFRTVGLALFDTAANAPEPPSASSEIVLKKKGKKK